MGGFGARSLRVVSHFSPSSGCSRKNLNLKKTVGVLNHACGIENQFCCREWCSKGVLLCDCSSKYGHENEVHFFSVLKGSLDLFAE